MTRIFEYKEYKAFIKAKLNENVDLRGYQGTLAKAAGCQASFFSQVLSSHIQLTPDHAANLAKFWKLTESEREFFVTLVIMERSASRELREMCSETLARLRKEDSLGVSLGKEKQIDREFESLYYTSWVLQSVHMAISIPELQTIKSVADRLQISPQTVSATLSTLSRMGLALSSPDGKWKIGKRSVHPLNKVIITRGDYARWPKRSWAIAMVCAIPRYTHFQELISRRLKISFVNVWKKHVQWWSLRERKNWFALPATFLKYKALRGRVSLVHQSFELIGIY